MRANGNFSDASLKRLHSVNGVGLNHVMSPSDAFDLKSPLVQTITCGTIRETAKTLISSPQPLHINKLKPQR